MTCKDLKRLTISDVHKAKSNTERLMNFAYAKDNRVFIPQQYKEDIDLCEYVAEKGCGLTVESVMEGSCFECDLDCVPGILYFCAVQAAELRERLKMFEDKLENGTLIELPCKVGDKVYVICYKRNVQPYIRVETVLHMNYLQGKSLALWQIHTEYAAYNAKDVIYSKSEAEQKLKELQE